MAIRKGEDWGRAAPLPAGNPVVSSDQELLALISASGGPEGVPIVGLLGGDLALTLGSPGKRERLDSDAASTVSVDVGQVQLDSGDEHWFVSHLVARRSWWRGPILVVANSAWMGTWNIAPRAHPGDGRFDVLSTTMGARQRWQARSRLAHGGHVPHPDVQVRRVARIEETLGARRNIWLDGELVDQSSQVTVTVHPEALTVVV